MQVKGGELDDVRFEPIKSWTVGTSGKIVYTLPTSIAHSTWHWIAIFRVRSLYVICKSNSKFILNFLINQDQYASLGEYITYVWVPKKPRSGDKSRTYEVVIPESSLRVPGKYLAAYMSDTQPYHMMGISAVFEVTRN